jgi:hypothetical protein
MEKNSFAELAFKISVDILKSSENRLRRKINENRECDDAALQGFIYQHMAVHYMAHAMAISKIIGMPEERMQIIMQEIINAGLDMARKIVINYPESQSVN